MADTRRSLDLDTYRWHNRLLLVFAPSSQDPHYQTQLADLRTASGSLAERDMVVLELPHNAPGWLGDHTLASEVGTLLRERFDVVADSFAVLLIGKDGGVKERRDAPFDTEELFGIIDSMPMRQREMHQA